MVARRCADSLSAGAIVVVVTIGSAGLAAHTVFVIVAVAIVAAAGGNITSLTN